MDPSSSPAAYTPSEFVKAVHGLSRLGYSSKVSNVFSSNERAIEHYMMGIVVVCGLLALVVVLWLVLLVAWQCMGSRAGFLSGRPLIVRKRPVDKRRRCVTQVFLVRSGCCVCGILLLASLFKFYSSGMVSFKRASLALDDANAKTQKIVTDGINVTESLYDITDQTLISKQQLEANLNASHGNLCPNAPEGSMNLLPVHPHQVTRALTRIHTSLHDILAQLSITSDFVSQTSETLSQAVHVSPQQQQVLLTYTIPLLLMTNAFMLGVALAAKRRSSKCYQRLLTYVVLPLFLVWMLLSFAFGLACLVTAILQADACAGGVPTTATAIMDPKHTMLQSLQNFNFHPQTTVFQAAKFYSTCQANTLPPFLDDAPQQQHYQQTLLNGINRTATMIQVMDQQGNETLNQLCGGNHWQPFYDTLVILHEQLLHVHEAFQSMAQLVTCNSVHPIYVKVVHQAACEHGVAAATWMAMCFFFIATCGLGMITLRSAWLDTTCVSTDDAAGMQNVKAEGRKEMQKLTGASVRGGFSSVGDEIGDTSSLTDAGSSITSSFHELSLSSSRHGTLDGAYSHAYAVDANSLEDEESFWTTTHQLPQGQQQAKQLMNEQQPSTDSSVFSESTNSGSTAASSRSKSKSITFEAAHRETASFPQPIATEAIMSLPTATCMESSSASSSQEEERDCVTSVEDAPDTTLPPTLPPQRNLMTRLASASTLFTYEAYSFRSKSTATSSSSSSSVTSTLTSNSSFSLPLSHPMPSSHCGSLRQTKEEDSSESSASDTPTASSKLFAKYVSSEEERRSSHASVGASTMSSRSGNEDTSHRRKSQGSAMSLNSRSNDHFGGSVRSLGSHKSKGISTSSEDSSKGLSTIVSGQSSSSWSDWNDEEKEEKDDHAGDRSQD